MNIIIFALLISVPITLFIGLSTPWSHVTTADNRSILGALILSWGPLSSELLAQSAKSHIRGKLSSYNDK